MDRIQKSLGEGGILYFCFLEFTMDDSIVEMDMFHIPEEFACLTFFSVFIFTVLLWARKVFLLEVCKASVSDLIQRRFGQIWQPNHQI